MVAGNESRVQSESLMALVRMAASGRQVATSRLHPVHVSTRPSPLTGVCLGRLERLRSKPPGTAVVPDQPALETFLLTGIKDPIMRMYLDMAEVGIKWHPVGGTDEALRKELVLAPFMQYIGSVRSCISVEALGSLVDVHAAADNVNSLTAMRMGAFLRQVSMGGPTAAMCVYASLRWWRVIVGAVDDGLFRPFRQLSFPHPAIGDSCCS